MEKYSIAGEAERIQFGSGYTSGTHLPSRHCTVGRVTEGRQALHCGGGHCIVWVVAGTALWGGWLRGGRHCIVGGRQALHCGEGD